MTSRSSRILSLSLALGVVNRVSAACEDYIGDEIARFSGECSLSNLEAALAEKGCSPEDLGVSSVDVAELCDDDAPIQFGEIQGSHQLDRRYMNGGGPLIDSLDGFEVEAGNIKRFRDNVSERALIDWPEYEALFDYNAKDAPENEDPHGYISNFDLTESCNLNTVMCCFIDDMNGSGFEEGDVTTDVCNHDIGSSPKSNHIKYGWSFFDGEETDTHCVGFTWADGSPEDYYKGNALFDVSLANTVNKGYFKSVPGAPLCACIEQMPVVEQAKCRTATGTSLEWVFKLRNTDDGSLVLHATNEASITYADCANPDLKEQVKATHDGTDIATLIDDYLVGVDGCAEANVEFLNDRFYVPGNTGGTKPYSAITEDYGWKIVVGEGVRFNPPDIDRVAADAEFRSLINAGCTDADENERPCLIRRFCDSCAESHRDIYYKRLTDLASAGSHDFLDLFLNNWFNGVDIANTFNVDFELYSSYADAMAGTNRWTFCNFNDPSVGFPRDCGPTGAVWYQWTQFDKNLARNGHKRGAVHAAFYVEIPDTSA